MTQPFEYNKPFVLDVNRACIRYGRQREGDSCPVYYAMEKAFPDADMSDMDLNVDHAEMVVYSDEGEECFVKFPRWLTRWIAAFDKKKSSVKPFNKKVKIVKNGDILKLIACKS